MVQNTKKPSKKPGNIIYLIAAALIITSIYFVFFPPQNKIEQINLSAFLNEVREENVQKIQVKDNKLIIELKNGNTLSTVKERGQTITEILEDIPVEQKQQIEIEIMDTESSNFLLDLFISFIPFLLIIGFFIFMMKQAQQSNNQAMSFGKSRARLTNEDAKRKTTFKDVAGAKEAKEELIEIVDFLKSPQKYQEIGAKIPKGVLLIGPPGTGKTLLARAVAGEANVPFFHISGSEFVEMFVGVGASRVRDLFRKAKKTAPCIIFIDEIDAVGRQRGAGLGGGHDEREQTLNQILTEMDGFETDTNIIVMAATNRPDVLDPALLRPGRFDRRVTVDMPDIEDREAILKIHARNKPLLKNVNLNTIAKQTPGFTGADLENLMNEAALMTARQNKKIISLKELESAIEKVLLGPERKSRILNKKEKEITAYHETGHAIVGHFCKNCDPVHKVSIVSRGMALGVTWFLPQEDKRLYGKNKFEDEIASLLGGHVTEKIVFNEVTTGSSNDLERATQIARRMVTEYGMSELGPVIYGEKNHEVFLGRDFGHVRNYSEEIAGKIDHEVKKIIEKGFKKATELIKQHRDELASVAKALIDKETLTRKEFLNFFKTQNKSTNAAKTDNLAAIG